MADAMSAAPSSAPAPSSTPSTPSTSSAPSSAPSAPSGASTPPQGKSAPQSTSGQSTSGKTDQSPGSSPAEKVAAEIRKHKLKVNGRELELEEPEVLRRAQLAEAAEQKFQEAARARKELATVLETFKNDPASVMKELGLNPREFAEKFLAGELKKEMLSPEQRELEELRAAKAEWDKQRQTAEEQTRTKAQQAEYQRQEQAAWQKYDSEITDALKAAKLPKTPEVARRIATRMRDALMQGYELDTATAVDLVRQEYSGDIQGMVDGLSGEALVKMLGPKLLKKIRSYDLSQIKAKLNPQQVADQTAAPVNQQPSAPRQTQQKALSPDEWREAMWRKAGL